MQCPLLYRFRVIDKLPEKPQRGRDPRHGGARGAGAALRRTGRGADTSRGRGRLVAGSGSGCWRSSRSWRSCSPRGEPGAALDEEELARWLAEAEDLVERWFSLEDPTRLEPAERELFVETGWTPGCGCAASSTGSTWRPTGEVRVVDYKTGKAPRAAVRGRARCSR